MPSITKNDFARYSRQIMLPEIGIAGQEKIKNAKVLMVGAGGLGCPALQYLCAAGVGTIGIIDFDKVEIHNLHRQILYNTNDIGKPKAQTAAEKLLAQNPTVNCIVYNEMLNETNIEKIIPLFDFIIDGSDNFATRYLVNDICVKFNKPLVYGSILKDEAQLAVFNYKNGKNLRDIYPVPPNPEDVPSCDQNGVLGVVPGIVGLYMANVAIQIILNQYDINALLIFDLKKLTILKVEM